MTIISVEGKSLGAELAVWGVPHTRTATKAGQTRSKYQNIIA
ncbi:TPA: hypothetical protein ACWSZN_000127 [Escherichia coli]